MSTNAQKTPVRMVRPVSTVTEAIAANVNKASLEQTANDVGACNDGCYNVLSCLAGNVGATYAVLVVTSLFSWNLFQGRGFDLGYVH